MTTRAPSRLRLIGLGSIALACLVVTAAMIYGAVSAFGDAQRSNVTQHHGTPEHGTVLSSHDSRNCNRTSCTTKATISVRFDRGHSIDGHTRTVVHVHGESDYDDGERIDVLVDPHQPGYAELPGEAFASIWDSVLCAIAAIVCFLILLAPLRSIRQLIAR